MARVTQTTLQVAASLKETAWALRWNTPRSRASSTQTNTVNPA